MCSMHLFVILDATLCVLKCIFVLIDLLWHAGRLFFFFSLDIITALTGHQLFTCGRVCSLFNTIFQYATVLKNKSFLKYTMLSFYYGFFRSCRCNSKMTLHRDYSLPLQRSKVTFKMFHCDSALTAVQCVVTLVGLQMAQMLYCQIHSQRSLRLAFIKLILILLYLQSMVKSSPAK